MPTSLFAPPLLTLAAGRHDIVEWLDLVRGSKWPSATPLTERRLQSLGEILKLFVYPICPAQSSFLSLFTQPPVHRHICTRTGVVLSALFVRSCRIVARVDIVAQKSNCDLQSLKDHYGRK